LKNIVLASSSHVLIEHMNAVQVSILLAKPYAAFYVYSPTVTSVIQTYF